MKKMIMAVAVLMIMLAGCAYSGKQLVGDIPKIDSEKGYATIHIGRENGFTACANNELTLSHIQVNHKEFYLLKCGERITFKVPAEKEVTLSYVAACSFFCSPVVDDHITIMPKKDKHYYFGNGCTNYFFYVICRFEEVSKSTYAGLDASKEETELEE